MMFNSNNKFNTMDIHLSMNEQTTAQSHNMPSQRISPNDCISNNDNDTDIARNISDNSSNDDTTNMFTKFAFPFKLHSILENSGKSGQESIISWLPSGKAFKIHKPKDFADVIMPQYFNQTKYRSFQRQLYIYGFDRVKDKASDDYGAYFHELFIRGASDLCLDMQRKKIKGTGLSNEERRKKASVLRENSKQSSIKSLLRTQSNMHQQSIATSNQSSMLPDSQSSRSQSMHANLPLNSLSSELQPQPTGKANPSNDWNNVSFAAVMKSARQVQEIAFRQDTLNAFQNNNSNNGISGRISVIADKMAKAGRRCSLGFVRGMGRRGSLFCDGDEVVFGDKKFYFTTNY